MATKMEEMSMPPTIPQVIKSEGRLSRIIFSLVSNISTPMLKIVAKKKTVPRNTIIGQEFIFNINVDKLYA
jgi:hypothetical protein